VYERLFQALGWRAAQRRLGLRVNVDRAPTRSELAEAVQASGLSLVRLEGLLEPEARGDIGA
jgi:hypothetical protein